MIGGARQRSDRHHPVGAGDFGVAVFQHDIVGGASSTWLAMVRSLCRIFRAASIVAPPEITSERLANVPQP